LIARGPKRETMLEVFYTLGRANRIGVVAPEMQHDAEYHSRHHRDVRFEGLAMSMERAA